MMQLASGEYGTGTPGQLHALDAPQNGVGLVKLTDASDCRTNASARHQLGRLGQLMPCAMRAP